jgi:spore germination cell wall hydrolase CwlJ-like protein
MKQILLHSPARVWRDYPREVVVLATLAVAAVAAVASATVPGVPTRGLSVSRPVASPAISFAPPPLLVRKLAPEDAIAINQAIPLSDSANPAARPFGRRIADPAAHARALDCLTSAVYYESGNEDPDGQRAVAQVVLNRVRHPAFPNSVCGVVYQGSTRVTGCQFTFTCDGSLNRQPNADSWARARKVAEAALTGAVFAPVGFATHYHAEYVVPYWASSLAKNAVIGAHIFYRWAGGWGTPRAFAQAYVGAEPDSKALRFAALAAEAAQPETTEELAAAVAEIPGAEAQPGIDGRVGVRFNIEARAAVEKAVHKEYVDKFDASENLRWTLGEDEAETVQEKPLGKVASATPVNSAGGSQAGTSQE